MPKHGLCDSRKLSHPMMVTTWRLIHLLMDTMANACFFFFYWCPGTSELHLDPHFLQPSVVYFSTPSPEGSIRISKTQVTSMFKYLPDPFLISICSMALKHQTLRAWGWGHEAAVPVSSCWGWAGERSR